MTINNQRGRHRAYRPGYLRRAWRAALKLMLWGT